MSDNELEFSSIYHNRRIFRNTIVRWKMIAITAIVCATLLFGTLFGLLVIHYKLADDFIHENRLGIDNLINKIYHNASHKRNLSQLPAPAESPMHSPSPAEPPIWAPAPHINVKCPLYKAYGEIITSPQRYPIKKFLINFNGSIMQANYVQYNIEKDIPACTDCNAFTNDHYLSQIRSEHYDILKQRSYVESRLVLNDDYGCDTCIIPNRVPMLSKFTYINSIWKNISACIRKNYLNDISPTRYRVYKGCEYDLDKCEIIQDKVIFIPQGCYYVVTDTHFQESLNVVVAHGYIPMTTNTKCEDKYPWWVSYTPRSWWNNFIPRCGTECVCAN